MWPCYIPPETDELFSSWFTRLCSVHFVKSHSFSKYFFDGAAIWNRDIDISGNEIILEKIIEHTPLNSTQIKKLFLNDYEGILFEKLFLFSTIINKIGVVHRKRKLYGLKYCPGCLENTIIYYRKSWRLATSIICGNCLLHLRDRCEKCNSPICFYRLETGQKNSYLKDKLNICYYCKSDLRSGGIFKKANFNEIEYQNYIDTTIRNGYNDHSQYSFQYFNLLLNLRRHMFSNSINWMRIRKAVENNYGISFSIPSHTPIDIEQNRVSLLIAFNILKDWPTNILHFSKENNLRYSDYTKDMENAPYIIYKLFREHF